MRRASALLVLPLAAVVLASCESATTVKNDGKVVPLAMTPRASVANGLPLGLTGNIAVDSFKVCSIGADATYSWSQSGWPNFTGFDGNPYSADPGSSGSVSVPNGGTSAPQAWANNMCKVAYAYPLPQHTQGVPVVTATWQPQAGVRLDSIIKDSVKARNLKFNPGPTEVIFPAATNTNSVAGVINNDYGSIAFFYFTLLPSLQLLKTADAASVLAGQQIGFQMVVTNNGPGVANVVTLTDPLPTGSGLSWSVASPASGCTITNGNLSCSLGPLAVNGSATVHIVSATTTASCASYSNTATAVADQQPGVQSTAQTTVTCPPGLSLSKTADAATVSAGSPIGFTLTASNAGPGTATSVTLTDALPTGTGLSWSINPSNSACSISTGVLSCSFGDLAPNSSASVHVSSPTTAQSCAQYPNTGNAQATNATLVQASASTTVQCPGLTVAKTADAASVSAGSPIGFTMTVTSKGPGTATGVTLSDPLPGAGLTWSVDAANSTAGCSISSGTLSCSFGDMAASASASVHVTALTTYAVCGTLNNTATAQATNVAAVNASASTAVTCTPAISLTKSADAASVNAGSPIGYTVTVNSTGNAPAQNVSISDPLPNGTGLSWSIDGAGSSNGGANCSISGGTLTCNYASVAPGTNVFVHLVSPTTSGSCGDYDNTATASATGLGPYTATANVAVNCINPCTATTITSNFNGTAIPAGRWIWFNAVMKVKGLPATGGVVHVRSSTIAFSANSVPYSLTVPDADITFQQGATSATTSFSGGKWVVTVPAGYTGNVFLSGLAFHVPTNFPGGTNPVKWTTTLSSNVAGVTYNWQWAAAVYTSFAATGSSLGVKAIDANLSPYTNSDHAGTPESFKAYVTGGARGGGGSNFTGSYSGTGSAPVCTQ